MKTLRSISTAVLLCLVLAVPASAAEVNLSLSTTSVILGTPVTATASGVATTNYGVAVIKEAPCTKDNATTMVLGVNEPGPFDQTVTLGYSTVGTYNVCAEIDHWTTVVEATLTVLAVPLPPAPAPVAVAPAPTAVVAPVIAPKPVVKPLTTAQKLHTSLVKCKKQKNKKKRVQCERLAKKKFRR
jgi:hypothetical protein